MACEAVRPGNAIAETVSLQDMAGQLRKNLPPATIFRAKEIITLDPARPMATAVAVIDDRIVAVGSLDELKAKAGSQPFAIDETFAGKVIVPGFVAQHDHPFLTALTMTAEIIAIEEWVLPSGTMPAARNADEYRKRPVEANARLKDPRETLVTWGYHHIFHGKLNQ